MDVVNIAYAREEVAKDLFVMSGEKVAGINPKYEEGRDFLLKPITKDNQPPELSKEEMEKLTTEGYMPLGVYFNYKGNKYGQINQAVGYSYLGDWGHEDTSGINTIDKFKSSSTFIMTLGEKIPEVTFIKNIGPTPQEEVSTLQVYYKKSIANNCVGDTCLTQTMPKVTDPDKVLLGWNTKADGTGEAFTKDTIVEGDMKVYAQWGEKPADPVIPANPTVPSKPEGKVEVIGGEDRTGTASLVSSKFFDKADNVVIARRDLFPDALTASVLAKALDAPILLTHTDHLDAETAKEIKRLGAKHAYIMGLNGAISKSVEEEISKKVAKVERIGAENRYETASLIGKKVVDLVGKKGKAVIATGENFADALSISSFAAKEGYPILLVKQNMVTPETEKALKELAINQVYVVGGDKAVSDQVVKTLPNLVQRISGKDRYETSALIADTFFKDSTKAFLATGQDFADALVVGPVAAGQNAPVLLTKTDKLPEPIAKTIEKANYAKLYVLGLEKAIKKSVWEKLK
ncbi:MAG: cell wall-binding repeat-containing protein [Firmicutes bacterium]|nr:cell wall-binding repeat-containing protein [Bacillota bacterium]